MKLLGFSAVHTRRLCDHPEDAPAYIAMMTSPTWLRQPQNLRPIQSREVRRPGLVKRAELPTVLTSLFLDPAVWAVALRTITDALLVEVVVHGRPSDASDARSHGAHWVPDDGATRLDPWVRAVVDFFAATEVAHATIAIGSADAIAMEGSMIAILRDGALAHPDPAQFSAMEHAYVRNELGTRYIRFPRKTGLSSGQRQLGSTAFRSGQTIRLKRHRWASQRLIRHRRS